MPSEVTQIYLRRAIESMQIAQMGEELSEIEKDEMEEVITLIRRLF